MGTKSLDPRSWTKINQWLLVLIIINIIIRIPRTPGILGDDAFVVLWMGHIISEGYIDNWTISLLSIFGLYPFASYPIGVPLIIASLNFLGLSYELISLVYSIGSAIIGVIGSIHLGKELFEKENESILFGAIYSLCHIFIRVTYYSVSVRGLFAALLPWFLLFSIRFLRQKKVIYLIASLVFALLLSLTHGLAIFLLIYVGVIIVAYILRSVAQHGFLQRWLGDIDYTKVTRQPTTSSSILSLRYFQGKMTRLNLINWVPYIFLIGFAYVIGVVLLPIDPSKTTAFLSNNNLIGILVNLIIDYGVRLGPLFMFFPIGIFVAYHNDLHNDKKYIHFVLVPMIFFTLPLSLYSSILFLPVFAYYSVIGFKMIQQTFFERWITLLILITTFSYGIMYNLIIAALPFWLFLIIIFIGGVAIIELIISLKNWYNPLQYNSRFPKRVFPFLLISITLFSLISTEGLIFQGENSYLSSDEARIIDYLNAQSNPGITFVPSHVIGRRLEAYGFLAIPSTNEDSALYYGWCNISYVIANTELSLSELTTTGRPFSYNGINFEKTLRNRLAFLDLTNTTQWQQAIELGLQFIIVEKLADTYGDVVHHSKGPWFSPLLYSAPLVTDVVVDGEKMALLRLH